MTVISRVETSQGGLASYSEPKVGSLAPEARDIHGFVMTSTQTGNACRGVFAAAMIINVIFAAVNAQANAARLYEKPILMQVKRPT